MPKKKTAASGFFQEEIEPYRAVIYARFSSSGQREESIDGQLRDCYEYARQHNITVIGEYIDKAISGRHAERRYEFQRMIKDSEQGHFNCVLMWKIDRFARNKYESAIYKHKLNKAGVRLFYAKENIPEGAAGIMFETIMEGYAEFYSVNLAENIARGYYDSALALKTLGRTCLGLRTGADGKYEIDPAGAALVRRIFEEYAAGERAKDIYARLNEEGHRTSRGGKFNKNSLRRILSNKKYIGIYEYEDIYVENGIPAIIDKELFEKVGKMLKINHDAPARGKAQHFLLTTKLFCGLCGSPMVGDGGTSHTGKAYAYYSCTKRKRSHDCKKETVPKDWIEDLVVNELVNIVHSDELIEQIADYVMEYQEQEKDNTVLHALENRKKNNEKAISNLLTAIESGIITPSTKTRLLELEEEKKSIEKGIIKEMLADPKLERDQVIYFLERFRDGDIEDEEYRIALVDTFLNAVYLYDDDHLVLVMNYSGDNSKVTLNIVEKAIKDANKGIKDANKGKYRGSDFEPSTVLKKDILPKEYVLFQ